MREADSEGGRLSWAQIKRANAILILGRLRAGPSSFQVGRFWNCGILETWNPGKLEADALGSVGWGTAFLAVVSRHGFESKRLHTAFCNSERNGRSGSGEGNVANYEWGWWPIRWPIRIGPCL